MRKISNWIENYWIQHFVLCLGIFGLGKVWALTGHEQLCYVAAGLFVLTLAVTILRTIVYPTTFMAEWNKDMGVIGYLGAAGSSYFFGEFVGRYNHSLGLIVWSFALALNVICIIASMRLLAKGGFKWNRVVPAHALFFAFPAIGAITGVGLGLVMISKALTVISFVTGLFAMVASMRHLRLSSLPEQFTPSLMAYVSVPSVIAMAWFTNLGTTALIVPALLVVSGQLMFCMMALRTPKFLSLSFGPSYGCFAFPFSIGATAFYTLSEILGTGHFLANIEIFVTTYVIVGLAIAFTAEDIRVFLSQKPKTVGAFCDFSLNNSVMDK